MSTDYYSRIEQQRGPRPSAQMLASIARGLRMSLDERDHLFRLAGHNTPVRQLRSDHISPGLMRVLDRLQDTPAQVVTMVGETLIQTPPAVALLGDETHYTGLERSAFYRWFTNPESRNIYPKEDQAAHGRTFAADLRQAYSTQPRPSRAADLVDALLAVSPEFSELWSEHEIEVPHGQHKRIQHHEVGVIEVDCQLLVDPDQSQALLVFTATPGTEDYDKLRLVSAFDTQRLS
jgi:MmyB-like transcription regulator ligand binding domain/Helix-turn-helix domain